jgi:hypothetical protein
MVVAPLLSAIQHSEPQSGDSHFDVARRFRLGPDLVSSTSQMGGFSHWQSILACNPRSRPIIHVNVNARRDGQQFAGFQSSASILLATTSADEAGIVALKGRDRWV